MGNECSTDTGAADEGGLLEYSVVYTDRALNLMSSEFQGVMKDISSVLKEAYNADKAVVVPGSGTYGMEAVARQFGQDKKCMVIRNGYFSYRWSDIFHVTGVPAEEKVMKASFDADPTTPQITPPDVKSVVAAIQEFQPDVVFAPHVETSTGVILSDEYIKRVSDAVHAVGGVFVLDAIAAGTIFADMKKTGVDALISAPQKGWSGPACCAFVMLSARGVEVTRNTQSRSFATNLGKWLEVMDEYTDGKTGFKYYTTLPTNSLRDARDSMLETKERGFAKCTADAWTLGRRVREVMTKNGLKSVAAEGYQSPGVVVVYAPDGTFGKRFKEKGIQVAGGVPYKLGEPKGLTSFRIGLFGLDKLNDMDKTVDQLSSALDLIVKEQSA